MRRTLLFGLGLVIGWAPNTASAQSAMPIRSGDLSVGSTFSVGTGLDSTVELSAEAAVTGSLGLRLFAGVDSDLPINDAGFQPSAAIGLAHRRMFRTAFAYAVDGQFGAVFVPRQGEVVPRASGALRLVVLPSATFGFFFGARLGWVRLARLIGPGGPFLGIRPASDGRFAGLGTTGFEARLNATTQRSITLAVTMNLGRWLSLDTGVWEESLSFSFRTEISIQFGEVFGAAPTKSPAAPPT